MIPLNEFYERNQEKMLKFLDSISVLKDKKSGADSNDSTPKRERPSHHHGDHKKSHSQSLSPRDPKELLAPLAPTTAGKTRTIACESITTSASETFEIQKAQSSTRYGLFSPSIEPLKD